MHTYIHKKWFSFIRQIIALFIVFSYDFYICFVTIGIHPATLPGVSRCLKIRIPKDRTGIVIGRNGRNISKIRSETNTDIKVRDSYNEETEIEICGTQDDCMRASLKICESIEKKTAMHTATSKTISVRSSAVGKVIGRHGCTVHYIKAESGAQEVEFDKAQSGFEAAVNPTCNCTITGSDEQIEKAIELIRRAEKGEDFVTKARFDHFLSTFGMRLDSDSGDANRSDPCVIS